MDASLLEQLSVITPEEQRLLDGEVLDTALYTSGHSFVVDAEKMLQKGQLIAVRPHTRFTPFPRHSHNYVEMVYMCRGETRHVIGGSHSLTLCEGELLLLNQHVNHSIEAAGMDDIAVNFLVLPPFFDYTLELVGTTNPLGRFLISMLQSSSAEVGYLHFRVADVLPVQNLVENLVWGLVQGSGGGKRDKVAMGLLFLELLHCTGRLETAEAGRGHVLVAEALREIQENYQCASLSAIARKYDVSVAYLSALVRGGTGQTFKALLQEKRLAKAADLLVNTGLTTDDIIKAVGYENTSYFYRIFREKFGIVPKEYRRTQGKLHS